MASAWLASLLIGVTLSIILGFGFFFHMLNRYGHLLLAERRRLNVLTVTLQLVGLTVFIVATAIVVYLEYAMDWVVDSLLTYGWQ